MSPIALALALFLQAQPVADPAATPAPAEPSTAESAADDRWPAGAPHDDYLFVAWCYGSLRAYLDLHDQVMPEVTRIETEFRPPDRKLSDDLKVYADMQKEARGQLKTFQSAMTAAEKASLRPINLLGADAVVKGRSVWKSGPEVTPARMAQAWMSWALPARCETTAKTLHDRAILMGASFKVNDEPEPEAPPAPETPAPAGDPAKVLLEGTPAPAAPDQPAEAPPVPAPNPN